MKIAFIALTTIIV